MKPGIQRNEIQFWQLCTMWSKTLPVFSDADSKMCQRQIDFLIKYIHSLNKKMCEIDEWKKKKVINKIHHKRTFVGNKY